jgi:hypothetical protein
MRVRSSNAEASASDLMRAARSPLCARLHTSLCRMANPALQTLLQWCGTGLVVLATRHTLSVGMSTRRSRTTITTLSCTTFRGTFPPAGSNCLARTRPARSDVHVTRLCSWLCVVVRSRCSRIGDRGVWPSHIGGFGGCAKAVDPDTGKHACGNFRKPNVSSAQPVHRSISPRVRHVWVRGTLASRSQCAFVLDASFPTEVVKQAGARSLARRSRRSRAVALAVPLQRLTSRMLASLSHVRSCIGSRATIDC